MKYIATILVLSLICVSFLNASKIGDKIAAQLEARKRDSTSASGYINVNESANANMFYWFFESQTGNDDAPVVMWMTGGPGCSSELALFFENGPYQLTDTFELIDNPYSWNKFAHLLYIDQPVGTGFSYANEDYVNDEALVAADVYTFLQQWFVLFPYADNDFYIVGESYGGHYVPSVAAQVVLGNQDKSNVHLNLKGVGIGNGLVDSVVQWGSYGPFAWKYGLINESVYGEMNETYAKCVNEIDNNEWDEAADTCGTIMGYVLESDVNVNYYDISKRCNPPPLCYNFTVMTEYLNEPAVQQALGVNNIKWETCNDEVNSRFTVDEEQSFASDIPILLGNDVTVFVYSGMLDLICNWVGGDMWTSQLEWEGQYGFNTAEMVDWYSSNGTVLGHFRTYEGFTFMAVEGAGHMVPHDQPEIALTVLQMIIKGKP